MTYPYEIDVVCWNPKCPTHCKSNECNYLEKEDSAFKYPGSFPATIDKKSIPLKSESGKSFVTCPFCQKINVLYREKFENELSQKIYGEPTSDAFELKLYDLFLERAKAADETIDCHAQDLTKLFLGLIGIYSALLSYFIVFNENLPQVPWIILILALVPLAFWIASVYINLQILCPIDIGEVDDLMRFDLLNTKFQEIIENRGNMAKWSNRCLTAGLVILVVVLLAGAYITQSESSYLVKLVVVSDNADLFENMGIETSSEGGVIFTESIELVSVKDQSYLVRSRDGNLTEFDKELVKGIIYL